MTRADEAAPHPAKMLLEIDVPPARAKTPAATPKLTAIDVTSARTRNLVVVMESTVAESAVFRKN
jgi:hypothetical protein